MEMVAFVMVAFVGGLAGRVARAEGEAWWYLGGLALGLGIVPVMIS